MCWGSWTNSRRRTPPNGASHWFEREHGAKLEGPVAYFCAEYGLHESLGIYSGGLGVLAGDHLKAASDMAIPFVGVGLFYRHGYFRQTIDADGHQEHAYPDYDPRLLPVTRVAGEDGAIVPRLTVEQDRRTCPATTTRSRATSRRYDCPLKPVSPSGQWPMANSQ